MKFKGLIFILQVAFVCSAYASPKKEVTFQSGSVELSGTLMLPKGTGPFPALVFLHGSGASTRDQNAWRAKKLVKQGYAALIFDKRGAGKSTGSEADWRYFSFDSLATDAIAAVNFLKNQREIIPDKIGLVAASQSGWVAPLAASSSGDIAFMVIISASVSTVAEDRLFERAARLRKEGFSKAQVSEATSMQELDQEVTRDHSNFPEFQTLWLENEDKDWFPRVYPSKYFLQDPSVNQYRLWFRNVIDYDPVPIISKLNIPVLWLFGDPSLDRFGPVQKSVERINSFIEEGKEFKMIQYADADHNLKGASYFEDIISWLSHL